MKRVLAFLLLMMVATGAAPAAENSPMHQLITGDDSRGWEAVGRLEFGGRSFCTGALIAPDLVLTAGHCLFDRATGEPFRADQIQFFAGFRNGRANAYRAGRQAVTHPEFQYFGGDRISRVAYDLGLIQLDRPIRTSSVVPFATADRPRKGAEVGVVSYAHDRADTPALQEVCHVLARRSGTLVLSCEVDFGSSGAPIFTLGDDGAARIVSVVSAKADVRGRPVSLGTSLKEPLTAMMALIEAAPTLETSAGPRVLSIQSSGPGAGAGAKFVRP